MRDGIVFLSMEMNKLEKAVTNVRLNAITSEVAIVTVTARAEQIPSTCTVTGLFESNGSDRSLRFFLENKGSVFSFTTGVAVDFFSATSAMIIYLS
jgi:hypothetical protein